jgi:hypothetical protein
MTGTGAYLLVAGFGVAMVGIVTTLAWVIQHALGALGLGW